MQTFPGGTLLPAKNILDGMISGLADIGNFAMSYQPGRFPVLEAVDLPLGFTCAKVASLALYDLVEKYQPKEFEKVRSNVSATGRPPSRKKIPGAHPRGEPSPTPPPAYLTRRLRRRRMRA